MIVVIPPVVQEEKKRKPKQASQQQQHQPPPPVKRQSSNYYFGYRGKMLSVSLLLAAGTALNFLSTQRSQQPPAASSSSSSSSPIRKSGSSNSTETTTQAARSTPPPPVSPQSESSSINGSVGVPAPVAEASTTTKAIETDGGMEEEKTQALRLRYDYANLDVLSPLGKRIAAHQSDCSLPMSNHRHRNRFGLGSDLHQWSKSICIGMGKNVRVRSESPWMYNYNATCDANAPSSMECYFPQAELRCPNDRADAETNTNMAGNLYTMSTGFIKGACNNELTKEYSQADMNAASMEVLFTRVSPVLLKEAERQLNLVFSNPSLPPALAKANSGGSTAESPVSVPDDLITVQVRWGDKVADAYGKEMEAISIPEYVEAVRSILKERSRPLDQANIYLSTEDPEAVKEFTEAAHSNNWTVFVDQYYTDMLPYRDPSYNGNPKMTKRLGGRPGLVALGSLLVSLEANDFVLTTKSNWSRLINELRKNIVHPRCQECTSMKNLGPFVNLRRR